MLSINNILNFKICMNNSIINKLKKLVINYNTKQQQNAGKPTQKTTIPNHHIFPNRIYNPNHLSDYNGGPLRTI